MKNLIFTTILFAACQLVAAAGYENLITEDYLRTLFDFSEGDTLKYSECKKKTYPTCTYVWGQLSSKDEKRLKYGLAPSGNKLQIIYAQAKSPKDFQRVTATYSDAETIDRLGVESVWSAKRKQLSLITGDYLVMHINIDAQNGEDTKQQAIAIAGDLLENL